MNLLQNKARQLWLLLAVASVAATGICGVIYANQRVPFRTLPNVTVSDTDRLNQIAAQAPKGEDIQLQMPAMVFAVKPFKVGRETTITSSEAESLLSVDPTYRRISQRVKLLNHEGGESWTSSQTSKADGPITMGIHMILCVQAVKFRDAQNKVRYYALFPNRTTVTSSVYGNGRPIAPVIPKLSRADFINPKDVDWMFGVKDFDKGI